MMGRLVRVDALTLTDHSYLTDQDECYYLGDYTARKNWAFSDTNQLIWNLKKPVSKRGLPEYYYKGKAIQKVADEFRRALGRHDIANSVLVPVPPSKVRSDPDYDDRMSQIDGDGGLGDGSTNPRATAAAVVGLPPVATMRAGSRTCAVSVDGTGWCWGDNRYGALGDGTTEDQSLPALVRDR